MLTCRIYYSCWLHALAWVTILTHPTLAAEPTRIADVLVTLIEQAESPAREAGLLAELPIVPGQTVAAGQLLAKIDDLDARLRVEKATAEVEIAQAEAANDTKVRFAKAAAEVAQAELQRALDSRGRFERSVSQTELDKLQLEADRGRLAVEQAQHELQLTQQTLRLKLKERELATAALQRRAIESPLAGVVAEVLRRRGEWVEPGQAVVRIVRVDRLRVEGFLSAEQASDRLVGRAVRLSLATSGPAFGDLPGVITFVSPEIDPVNGQVRIWAEIDNRARHLRPGMRGSLTIEPPLVGELPRKVN